MASVMVERPPSAHGKLHKRNPSDSSRLLRKSLTMPSPTVDSPSLDFKRKVNYEGPQSSSSPSLKIKPYVRWPPQKDTGHVDLSRSMAENETLMGLGLGLGDSAYNTTYTLGTGNVSDVSFTPVRNQRHRRSTSGNSLISTHSNGLRQQPSTYVHPLRQTPRPYTPPISKSYTSTAGSGSSQDDVVEQIPRPADSAEALRQLTTNTSSEPFGGRRSESLSNFPNLDSAPSPQLRTSDLSERLGSYSQTSLPAGRRSRGTTIQSIDTVSPSSRPSLDKAFHFIRGQRSNGTDTELIEHDASRAASIRAARQAYQEREEAKDRKAEQEELKQAERDFKKQHKREERKRRKSEATDRSGARSREQDLQHEHVVGEKEGSIAGAEYATLKEVRDGVPEPSRLESVSEPGRLPERQGTSGSSRLKTKNRGAKSTWAIFLAWFRTRLLRMGR